MFRIYRPGNNLWIAERHGTLYHQEFDWDLACVDLVAEILVDMERNFETARELHLTAQG